VNDEPEKQDEVESEENESRHLKPLFEDIASKKEYNQVWVSEKLIYYCR